MDESRKICCPRRNLSVKKLWCIKCDRFVTKINFKKSDWRGLCFVLVWSSGSRRKKPCAVKYFTAGGGSQDLSTLCLKGVQNQHQTTT